MEWEFDTGLQQRLVKLVTEGYRQSEILCFVSKEFGHYAWSKRTLTRRLKHFDIQRHDHAVTANQLINYVNTELQGPGKLLGYRAMYRKIRIVHGLRVKMKEVYRAMALLDPDGLRTRKLVNKRKRFQRRVFTSKGPNWVWSVDGHDKLMGWHKSEYPLAVHGCVDTFSRKILWLKAWPSNSSPKLPAQAYLDTVKSLKVVPHFIRSDRGNENSTLFTIQNFLRGTTDGSSYIYGSSITNQVIERWWRDLRERNGNYFRSCLDSLSSSGLYNSGNETCRVILAIILIPLLQHELNIFKDCWNSHRIRRQDIRRPCGIPNFLYAHPETYGCHSAGYEVSEERVFFIEDKLKHSNSAEYVQDGLKDCVRQLLEKSHLLPVTLHNFIDAYAVIYNGCKERGINLEFLKL